MGPVGHCAFEEQVGRVWGAAWCWTVRKSCIWSPAPKKAASSSLSPPSPPAPSPCVRVHTDRQARPSSTARSRPGPPGSPGYRAARRALQAAARGRSRAWRHGRRYRCAIGTDNTSTSGGGNYFHHSHRSVVTDLDLEAREHGTAVLVQPMDKDERPFDDRPWGNSHSPWDLDERTVHGRPYIRRRPV